MEPSSELEDSEFPILVAGQRRPGMTGFGLLQSSMDVRPDMIRIILTGYTDTATCANSGSRIRHF